MRLALTIMYASRINDWKSMEKITIEEWLVKIGGRKTFEKFWKPLLLAKLRRELQACFGSIHLDLYQTAV
ncbi:MAG: hypothetical protein R3C61_10865 [Bacteroidia bacterium]